MSHSEPVRTAAHRTQPTILAALITLGMVVSAADHELAASASSATPPVAGVPGPPPRPHGNPPDRSGAADGVVPDGVAVVDDRYPAVARLDPALRSALRRATAAAAAGGVNILVTSGWRSPKYQEQLLRKAISKYGSKRVAARWVATVDTSPHVAGEAVDVGPARAAAWLSGHGARYGLCQIYRNEPWHYELRPRASAAGCPPMYADPTHDPRMQ